MSFSGDFEIHITVSLSAPEEWSRFQDWCISRGLKCVHIALERGQSPSQPMVTVYSAGTLEGQLKRADELRCDLEAAGFRAVRVKLEVSATSEAVPDGYQEDDCTKERYFESHIKLLLPDGADLVALKNAVSSHGAHLSRNARRVREDGNQERFVTQRCYATGREGAQSRFDELLQTLATLPYPVIETEQEYVVFDSNAALDNGWLEPKVRNE